MYDFYKTKMNLNIYNKKNELIKYKIFKLIKYMTLKNKLARLNGLYNEENEIKKEITNLRQKLDNIEDKQYNYSDLCKKYNDINFNNITPRQLDELMKDDFIKSNITELEKKNIYEHNMNILKNILNKSYNTNNINKYKSIKDVRDSINIEKKKNGDIKEINVTIPNNKKKKSNEVSDDDYDTSDLDEDPELLKKIERYIDIEYEFNLKILKTYSIFCHYRNIMLPSNTDYEIIKENLEGYVFVPKEKFKDLKKNEKLLFLTLQNEKIVMLYGNFKKINKWGLHLWIPKLKRNMQLNYLNPIFKKITENCCIY